MVPSIRILRWLRYPIAFISFAIGLLALAATALGPEPVLLWSSGNSYYFAHPSPYSGAWAAFFLFLSGAILIFPRFMRKDGR
jgi:membrane protein implicated in regulation of membrane protease activity